MTDFTKQFFQKAWGKDGYYETFSYGVGIGVVCHVALNQFFDYEHTALEIGSGGGTFTERMNGMFKSLTVVDVIKKPESFKEYDLTYIELPDQSYNLPGIKDNSIDFCFSYNVFCHLSNEALKEYLKNVNRVLRKGGNFIFMLSNYRHTKQFCDKEYQLGDLLPMGHYYQDERTLKLIMGDGWEIVNENLLPEHRDIIIHLRKKC